MLLHIWNEMFLRNNLLEFLLIVIATLIVGGFARRFFRNFLESLKESEGIDRTNYHFFRSIIVALIYGLGFAWAIYSVPAFRTIGTTMLAGAGVLALAVSFASQQALSNIVSGLFVVIFKPFKINDRVILKAKGLEGVIEDITLRHTVIRDYENRRIIVPNSVISNEIIVNSDYTDDEIRKHLIFSVSYSSDLDKAIEIIREEAEKHPHAFDHRTEQEMEEDREMVPVRVTNLGNKSVDLKAFIWVKNQQCATEMASDLRRSVKLRFEKEGIQMI